MIYYQFTSFIAYTILGIISCIVFDLFRSIRKNIKTPNHITYVEDLIFWLIISLLLLYVIKFQNNGEFRIYYIFALLLGTIFYYLTISKYIFTLLAKTIKYLKTSVLKITKSFKIIKKAFNLIIKNDKNIKNKKDL